MSTARSVLLALMLALLASACCHVNNLKANLPSVQRVLVTPVITGTPVVDIHAPQTGNAALNVIGTIATVAAAEDSYAKIIQAAQPERLAVVLQQTFTTQVAAQLKFQPVSEKSEPHDAELQVLVDSYGIRQIGPEFPVEYFFAAEARLVRVPSGELIWRDCEDLSGPLSPVIIYGSAGASANTAIGIAALSELEVEDLRAMFDRIADDAGRILAASMARDSVLD